VVVSPETLKFNMTGFGAADGDALALVTGVTAELPLEALLRAVFVASFTS
jgi:hypothetical protein